MTKITELPVVTTLASTDLIVCVANGVTSAITKANLQAQIGGSGTGGSGGTVGATNLFSTPNDLSLSQTSKFTQYDSTSPGLTRPSALEVDCPTNGGSHVLYEAIATTKLVPGSTYTVGATVTRIAGSGTGKVRANIYYEGPGNNLYAADQTVTDGTAYRTSLTFTVPSSGVTSTHAGFDFTTGGGNFQFSNVTLVAGSTDNPNAT